MTPPLRARIIAISEIARDVFEVDVAMVEPRELEHRPGQYVSVRLPGSEERRSYSIASRPGRRDGLTLLIRRATGTGSQLLTRLAVDADVELEGPRGDFGLSPSHRGDAVFAATGVGVAPLFPMMEALVDDGGDGRILLCWGLLEPADRFWHARTAALAASPRFASHVVFSGLGEGFVTQAVIDTVSALRAPHYYLCGNGQMVRDVVDGLTARGVPDREIRTDWGG